MKWLTFKYKYHWSRQITYLVEFCSGKSKEVMCFIKVKLEVRVSNHGEELQLEVRVSRWCPWWRVSIWRCEWGNDIPITNKLKHIRWRSSCDLAQMIVLSNTGKTKEKGGENKTEKLRVIIRLLSVAQMCSMCWVWMPCLYRVILNECQLFVYTWFVWVQNGSIYK